MKSDVATQISEIARLHAASLAGSRQLSLDLEPGWAVDFKQRVEKEYRAGNLTPKFRDVAIAQADLARAGNTTPTERQIADRAGCHVATVGRAKRQLRALQLVTSRRRGELRNGRWRRISCEYQLHLPLMAVLTSPRPQQRSAETRRCNTQAAGGSEGTSKNKGMRVVGGVSAARPYFTDQDSFARWNAQRQLALLAAMDRDRQQARSA